MAHTAIRTENLTRSFGTVQAVDHLTLEVPAGIIFGFLGPNGAGKTTTIRLLLGLLEPTGGRAEVMGFDTRTQSNEIRRQTGVLLEHPGLYERLSAEDNLDFYGRIWRLSSGERQARIKDLLTRSGLWERRKEPVRTWSRGMKQKLAIARALLHRPALLFLDEPTSGLDPVAAKALRDDLLTLVSREGVTVFLTTHNLAEAEELCDQVGVIHHGQLIAQGPPDRLQVPGDAPRLEVIGHGFSLEMLEVLRAQPEVIAAEMQDGRLLIKLDKGANVAPLVRLIVNAGAEVEEVQRGGIESVFLDLVRDTEGRA